MKDNNYLVDKLLKAYPDRLPLNEESPFELGRLIGQQDVVKYILKLLQVEQDKEQEIK